MMRLRKRQRRAALGLVVLAAIGLVSSCRQFIGIEDRTVTCGSLSYQEETCASCMDTACCGAEEACARNPACTAAYECSTACALNDATCRIQCEKNAPAGLTALDAIRACRANSCAESCSTCGGLVDSFGAKCDQCVQTKCCDISTSCLKDPGCRDVMACVPACTEPDCPALRCLNGPERDDAVGAIQQCITQFCSDDCGLGRDWTCVGAFTWVPPKSDSVTYRVKLVELTSQKPAQGVDLTLCNSVDNTCDQHATTDDTGVATFVLKIHRPLAFLGYLRVAGGMGYQPMLLYVNKPIASDQDRTFYVLSATTYDSLIKEFGVMVDESRGFVFATGLDCKGFAAPGISFKLKNADAMTQLNYFAADAKVTTKYGTVGFLNVPVASVPVVLEMFVGPDPTPIPAGNTLLTVEANTISEVQLYPLARQ